MTIRFSWESAELKPAELIFPFAEPSSTEATVEVLGVDSSRVAFSLPHQPASLVTSIAFSPVGQKLAIGLGRFKVPLGPEKKEEKKGAEKITGVPKSAAEPRTENDTIKKEPRPPAVVAKQSPTAKEKLEGDSEPGAFTSTAPAASIAVGGANPALINARDFSAFAAFLHFPMKT